MDNYIGEIKAFPYNFVPEGWLPCTGQPLQISQYQELYAVIGPFYNPPSNTNVNVFYLPNLIGVVLTGASASEPVGTTGGTESAYLSIGELAVHTHTMQALKRAHANTIVNMPSADVFITDGDSKAQTKAITIFTKNAPNATNILAPGTVTIAGGSLPHENRMPFLPMNFGICVYGAFPPHQV